MGWGDSWGGTTTGQVYPLFSGFVEAWPATWSGAAHLGRDTVEVQAVDAMKVLNLAKVSLTRDEELSGARIDALLDAISWPASLRDIDQGTLSVQAVTLTNAGILQHIQDVSASEGGQFFFAADGTATFFDRFHGIFQEDDDLWGDADGEKHYASLTTSYDDTTLWNEVIISAPDLTDQSASDTQSIEKFSPPTTLAPRTLSQSTLLTTEADMLTRAEILLAKYKEPQQRITSLAIDNASLDDSQWPRMFVQDIHERILVRKRPFNSDILEQPSFIEGISWSNDAGHWRLTWALSSTTAQQGQWQLGVAGASELGVTTSLVST